MGLSYRVLTWEEVIGLINELARTILRSKFAPDIILAVSRGGFLPAVIISDFLGVDMVVSVKASHWSTSKRRFDVELLHGLPIDVEGKRVLIVDDVADTGRTLKVVSDLVRERGAAEVRTAVVHLKSTSKFIPDYYVEEIREWYWIIYPWSALEDTINLIVEVAKGRRFWTLEELVKALEERYGAQLVSKLKYYVELALERLSIAGALNYNSECRSIGCFEVVLANL